MSDAATTTAYPTTIQFPQGQQADNYTYNALGQLVADGLENKYYTYYATGLPHAVYSDAAKTMLLARFTYDERGQRLLKESYSTDGTTLTQRTWYLRDAGGGEQCVLVHDATAALTSEQLTIGGTRGLGVYERIAKRTLYNITDHLGNVRVVLDHTDEGVTSIAAAHDYYPHGGIMPGRSYTSALLRSLEYQGMERDGETDLVSFELRSMDVRLGRWQAPDPYAQYHSPYLAMGNNPVSRVDPDGGYDGDPNEPSYGDSRDASRQRAEERWAKHGNSQEQDPRSGATSDNQELQRHIEEDESFRDWMRSTTPFRRKSDEYAYSVRTLSKIRIGTSSELIENDYEASEQEQAETWYYMIRADRNSQHSMIYDPVDEKIYEVNAPRDRNGNELETYQILLLNHYWGIDKAVAYTWDLNNKNQMLTFWEREGDNIYFMMPIVLNKPEQARAFFQSASGRPYAYRLMLNNCRRFICQGIIKGGGDFPIIGLFPNAVAGTYTKAFTKQGIVPMSESLIVD